MDIVQKKEIVSVKFPSTCDMGFPCDIKHCNSHAIRSLLCLRSESEYIMGIQSSGFAVAVTLLAENTEIISDASMVGGSQMNTRFFFMA